MHAICFALMTALASLTAATVHASRLPAQPGVQPEAVPMYECASRMRALSTAIIWYTEEHNGLPPDLQAAAEFLDKGDGGNRERLAWPDLIRKYFVSPADPGTVVPNDAGPDWLKENTSYVYLGRPGLKWEEVPEWSATAIAHLRLDRWHTIEPTPAIPDGRMSVIAYPDGHVDVMSYADAQRVIAESKQIWEALATGAPLPDRIQAVRDLDVVIKAVLAYAAANAGALPPDLGATLAFVPEHPKRGATLQQRARVFLSPRAQRNTFVPEDPTPGWVNRNASCVYLGGTGILTPRIADPQRTVLVHARFADAVTVVVPGGVESRMIPIANALGAATLQSEENARWTVGESRKVLDAALGRGPLPDFQNAVHDVTLLSEAIKRYAAAHDGVLPPDLAATWDYLPDEALLSPTIAARANVYVSPRAERVTRAPDEPDAAWIRRAASYIYLPGPGLTLSALRNQGRPIVLVHAPLDEPFDVWVPNARIAAVPYGDEMGWVVVADRDWVASQIAESREVLKSLASPEAKR